MIDILPKHFSRCRWCKEAFNIGDEIGFIISSTGELFAGHLTCAERIE